MNEWLLKHRQNGAHLHSSVARAHHTCTSRMHLCQIVEGQDVACLWGQVEEFKCLLVVTLHTDAICGMKGERKKNGEPNGREKNYYSQEK